MLISHLQNGLTVCAMPQSAIELALSYSLPYILALVVKAVNRGRSTSSIQYFCPDWYKIYIEKVLKVHKNDLQTSTEIYLETKTV